MIRWVLLAAFLVAPAQAHDASASVTVTATIIPSVEVEVDAWADGAAVRVTLLHVEKADAVVLLDDRPFSYEPDYWVLVDSSSRMLVDRGSHDSP